MPNKSSHLHPSFTQPLDYLVFGHLTSDLTETGSRLGGTAAFSGLTANALGLKSGIITSFGKELDISPIKGLWFKNKISKKTTTFKNISNGSERSQYLYSVAKKIIKEDVPTLIQPPKIIHLGPVANEVDPEIMTCFPNSLKCLTAQGWFRGIGKQKQVIFQEWQHFDQYLEKADIVVISLDDVQKDEDKIAIMAGLIPVFVVTENNKGARVYWHNDVRFFSAPEVKYLDDTGAGDVFATAFFYRYLFTKNPWEACRFAVLLASWSVTRAYLNSIPTPKEIEQAKIELLTN
ncbi:MAG: PfkB family carbohydrate kinase [Chloroflexota bacterium]|nr:PfkB family carbohydrate kinase [Chloroflexota bacterium]